MVVCNSLIAASSIQRLQLAGEAAPGCPAGWHRSMWKQETQIHQSSGVRAAHIVICSTPMYTKPKIRTFLASLQWPELGEVDLRDSVLLCNISLGHFKCTLELRWDEFPRPRSYKWQHPSSINLSWSNTIMRHTSGPQLDCWNESSTLWETFCHNFNNHKHIQDEDLIIKDSSNDCANFQHIVYSILKWIKRQNLGRLLRAGEWRMAIMPIKIQLSVNKSCFIEFTANVLRLSLDNYQIALMICCHLS